MQGVERGGGAFFKGISLSEYMKDMACPEEEPPYDENQDDTNDLYLHCQPASKRVSNFAIKEIDEDNYDETKENANLIVQPLHVLPPPPSSTISSAAASSPLTKSGTN